MVVAGSMSGALKVWDLEQAKSKRKAVIFITSFLVTVCKSVQTLILIYSNYLGFFLVMRTLTGHTSSIKSLDFHPYGDYCTSGSLDCNVKVRCVFILLINLYDPSVFFFIKFTIQCPTTMYVCNFLKLLDQLTPFSYGEPKGEGDLE